MCPQTTDVPIMIPASGVELEGSLNIPRDARGAVLFAHGSGSGRFSSRNRQVARELSARGFGYLLFDLLTEGESSSRRNVFDVELLAERLLNAAQRVRAAREAFGMPLGFFGASTGAAAALTAAARRPTLISAVVSRGGRPDLAGPSLALVQAPTLLIVGGADTEVVQLNQSAYKTLPCEKQLNIVPGATHLFDEPGALERVSQLAGDWFERWLV